MLVNAAGLVFVGQRNGAPGPAWQMPQGGIDPGEGPVQALHRGAREETGWRIADLRRFGAFQRYVYMPDYGFWAHKVQQIYLARAVIQLGPPTEGWHVPLWMKPAEAARLLDVEGDTIGGGENSGLLIRRLGKNVFRGELESALYSTHK